MFLQITLINAILFASLTNASDTKLSPLIENRSPTIATTFPTSANMMLETGTDLFIPGFMLEEEVELTPEESQLHRVNLRKIFSRLSKITPDKIRISSGSKFHKPAKLIATITPETGDRDTNTSITSASAIAPDSDKVDDTEYSADDETNTDLDTSPEETELRRGGRGGRGGRGRGRGGRGGRGRGRFGRGRGRFGRGRFGRGRRFGRFGGRRFGGFGRFGGWGSGWNDDCGGDNCGDC